MTYTPYETGGFEIPNSMRWWKELEVIMAQLPKPGESWTAEERAKWLKAIEAVLNLLIEVQP